MDAEKIKSEVIAVLVDVAPEVEVASLDPAKNFRDQFEFDSIDFVDLMLRLEKRLGITIPQSDYPKLSSLNGALRYLMSTAADPLT
jgi:acyl carrier protein